MSRHTQSFITEPRIENPRPSKKVKESTETASTQVSEPSSKVMSSLRTAHSQNDQYILDQIQVKKEAKDSWTDSAKIEDIKKKYYDSNNQCKICGMKITRYFKGHISTHEKKQKKFRKNFIFEQKNNLLQIKCRLCLKSFELYDTDKKLEDHLSKCKEQVEVAMKNLIKINNNKGIHPSLFKSSESQNDMPPVSEKSPTKSLEDGSNSVLVKQLQKELEQTKRRLYDLTQQQSKDRADLMNVFQKQTEDNRFEIDLNKSLTNNLQKEVEENKNELDLMKQEQIKTKDHLNIVSETTEMLKIQGDNTTKKVEEITPRLEVVEKKTDDHEESLRALLKRFLEKTEQPKTEQPKTEQPIQNETRPNILNRVVRKPKESQTDKTLKIEEKK